MKERYDIGNNQKFGVILTLESAKIDTPPATRSVHKYSENEYLMPYTRVPISITVNLKIENN